MNALELTQTWTKELEKNGKSAHTSAAYRRALEHFIAWNRRVDDGNFNPAAIIPRDIENWKAYQQTDQNASPATTNQRLVVLSNFFQWALSKFVERPGAQQSDGGHQRGGHEEARAESVEREKTAPFAAGRACRWQPPRYCPGGVIGGNGLMGVNCWP